MNKSTSTFMHYQYHRRYHILLPRQAANLAVVVMFQVGSDFLALPIWQVASANCFHILQNSVVSPCPGDVVASFIFLIKVVVLQPGIAKSHQVMQAYGCQDDELDSVWILLHRSQHTSPAVCKDAEVVLYHTTNPEQTVVEDPFFVVHFAVGVRLHHPRSEAECVVSYQEVRSRSVIMWQGLWVWKAKSVIFQSISHWGIFENLGV